MKLLIAFVVLFAIANAAPQEKSPRSFECIICHFLAPSLEDFADREGELAEDFLLKECKLIPFLDHLCEDWVKKNVDPLIELLRADECMSGCIACDLVLHCGSDDCSPSCGRPSCTGCSAH